MQSPIKLHHEENLYLPAKRGRSLTGHTLVVGAGVSGLSVAMALLQRRYSVTVLERSAVGGE